MRPALFICSNRGQFTANHGEYFKWKLPIDKLLNSEEINTIKAAKIHIKINIDLSLFSLLYTMYLEDISVFSASVASVDPVDSFDASLMLDMDDICTPPPSSPINPQQQRQLQKCMDGVMAYVGEHDAALQAALLQQTAVTARLGSENELIVTAALKTMDALDATQAAVADSKAAIADSKAASDCRIGSVECCMDDISRRFDALAVSNDLLTNRVLQNERLMQQQRDTIARLEQQMMSVMPAPLPRRSSRFSLKTLKRKRSSR